MQVILAGSLLDVISGNLIPNPYIWIVNNQIVNITADLPPNAEIIDIRPLIVMPGLIDCHTHITYHFGNGNDLQHAIENARATVLAGFTTIRNQGCDDYLDIVLRDLIASGQVIGPEIIASGVPILPEEYSSRNAVTAVGVTEAASAARAKELVATRVNRGANCIKVFNGMNGGEPELKAADIRQIVNAAHPLSVSAHSYEPAEIVAASDGGCVSVEHGSFLDPESAAVLSRNQTAIVPTLYLPRYYLENSSKFDFPAETWDFFRKVASKNLNSVRLAQQYRIPIAYGTDAVAGMHGRNANEFYWLNQAGLTPLECIQCATINAARILGRPDLGIIRSGARANLIGLTGDPVENLSRLTSENIIFVMVNGKINKNLLTKSLNGNVLNEN